MNIPSRIDPIIPHGYAPVRYEALRFIATASSYLHMRLSQRIVSNRTQEFSFVLSGYFLFI
jgi:hypothetical protein